MEYNHNSNNKMNLKKNQNLIKVPLLKKHS
jgi:hypothetical protein